jgi:phospholipase C
MPQNADIDIPGLEHIQRVVVLMFENRSFDHIFGAMPGVNGLFQGGKFKPDCYNLPNPLKPPSASNTPVNPAPVDASQPLAHDFNHDFGDGMMPDLFGPVFTVTADVSGLPPCNSKNSTYTSGYANGGPVGQQQPIPLTYPATNPGFYSTLHNCMPQGQSALSYFKDGDLKVLHTLAKHFVVCDSWHCDMPGHTEPNRLFIHCGTTGDRRIDDHDDGICDSPTIFELIDKLPSGSQPSGWKMYAPVDQYGDLGQLDTRFLNSNVQNRGSAPITEFATDCQNGTLPFYSFIMCWSPGHYDAWTDTSMHPYSLVQPGENLLAAVYNTLRKSACWEDTLLVVTFDENGGIYDHVFPPTTTPPNHKRPVIHQTDFGCCGNNWKLESSFDFSLLGVRIPALLISPWLTPGVDSHPYQNTSVVRFLIDRMNAQFGTKFLPLTERDKNAPRLDTAFTRLSPNGLRRDCPIWIEPYKTLPSVDPHTGSDAIPYSAGALTPWSPPEAMAGAPPVGYIQELLNIYVAPLPGSPDSGQEITRSFATNAEVAAYTQERLQAANRYYESRSQSAGA